MHAALAFLFHQWRDRKLLVALAAFFMVVAPAADLILPIYAGRIVDDVGKGVTRGERDALLSLGWMMLFGAVLVAARYLNMFYICRLSVGVMARVAGESFWRVQRFSTAWHADNFAGSMVRKITRGMWALDMLSDTVLIFMLQATIALIGAPIILGLHAPMLGVIAGVSSIIYVVTTVTISRRYVMPAARLSNQWDTRIGGALADAVTCNAVVKSFAAEEREDAYLGKILAKWQRRTIRTWLRMVSAGTTQNIMLLALRGIIVGDALWLWLHGRATAGDITYVFTTYLLLQGYLRDVGQHINNLQRAANDMEDMVKLYDEPIGVADKAEARTLVVDEGRIEFDRVTFRYGAHVEPLFRDLTLRIEAGERVGLVGHSGSGKSTFVKLIQRLYDVTDGRVLIDEQNVAAVTQNSLRSAIALVPQEAVLFHRSLAENIAYARPGATEGEIRRAAELANADQFIRALPRGYGTLVGERGVKLSGGERQRVALARAFLADAPILILDEATASLDSESEALIQEAMQRLLVGRTSLVIAHRLSTVRSLDRILVFDHGSVVEEGRHELLAGIEGGIYRRLFERQAMGLVGV